MCSKRILVPRCRIDVVIEFIAWASNIAMINFDPTPWQITIVVVTGLLGN